MAGAATATTFAQDTNSPPLTKQGIKGSDVYTEEGVGDLRVSLFQMLVRNCEPEYIQENIQKLFNQSADLSIDAFNFLLRDFVVMTFQTRDIRGGKGERDLFYHMLLSILAYRPNLIAPLIRLVPEYGCWRDLWAIHKLATTANSPVTQQITETIVDLAKWIFFEDLSKLEKKPAERISLLGKWLPREGSTYANLAETLATSFYPNPPLLEDRFKEYRKSCSKLNRALKTTEINMCSHTWSQVNPNQVPGRLFKKCRKAFLNEVVDKKKKINNCSNTTPDDSSAENFRFPADFDRQTCRRNFLAHLEQILQGNAKAKGGQTVFPHEIVKDFIYKSIMTKAEKDLLQAQWNAIREETLKSLKSQNTLASPAPSPLQRIVPMSDFSGSMGGTPMEVSMALGILVSEINHPAFRDHLLTFDSNPEWLNFEGMTTLFEKVKYAQGAPWGASTDFQKACDLILERLVKLKVPQDEAPTDLLVFTDMGFDEACGIYDILLLTNNTYSKNQKTELWQTHLQMIRNSFKVNGYEAPRIIVWNLRAEYKDFHAMADEEGVVVLSGWSPAILKTIMKEGVQVRTPYEGLREILDDPRYDLVRSAFDDIC